ncbi:proepiregulin-like isoform X1 [Embiotoca jacksoni]|uniref:proepiregulin-like isoform X1 n=1 Tax=Embiotoca jacksoni TaxID=100190 RepID=UPI0037036F7B
MGHSSKPSALLSLIAGVMLIWPDVLTESVSPELQAADSVSLSAGVHQHNSGQGEERPRVVKRSIQGCDSTFDNYCLNNGQCMLLVDINEHHCKCERGFYGHRCDTPELVVQPIREEQILVTVFFVSLLITGLSGALYFCCKWYKKKYFPRQQKCYKGVQTV